MRKLFLFSAALVSLMAPSTSFAQSKVQFNGSIEATCEIIIGAEGKLAPTPELTTLSSENPSGERGYASIRATNANFSASTSAPTVFTTAPATGNDDVTFESLYKLSGATVTAEDTAGNLPTDIAVGITTMEVGLTATKSKGVFVEGAYLAEVKVTCE